MYCPKCGNVVSKNAFFCQWCGEKIDLVELDSIAERIKYIRKQTIEKNTSDLEICKYVSKIYRDRSYLQSYDSFEAFGQNVLDIEKSDLLRILRQRRCDVAESRRVTDDRRQCIQ